MTSVFNCRVRVAEAAYIICPDDWSGELPLLSGQTGLEVASRDGLVLVTTLLEDVSVDLTGMREAQAPPVSSEDWDAIVTTTFKWQGGLLQPRSLEFEAFGCEPIYVDAGEYSCLLLSRRVSERAELSFLVDEGIGEQHVFAFWKEGERL